MNEGKHFKKEKLINGVLRNILRDKNNIQYKKNIYPNFKKILDKIFSSNSIRNYIYQLYFLNQELSNYLFDRNDALYCKRVYNLEKNI